MATKTLILRPIKVSTSNDSLVTLQPSSTTMSNAHTLVNEEVADDDSTYVAITGTGGKVYYYFEYNKPENLESITNVVVIAREKLETGSNLGGVSLYINDTSYPLSGGSISTTEYNTRTCEASTSTSSTVLDKIISALKDATSADKIYFQRTVNTNSSKMSPLRTTQVYMEITYEASEPIPPEPVVDKVISIKKNGVWTTINHTLIYHKINNVWTASDTSILQNNQKFIIKEVE